MNIDSLREAGLTDGEIKVYLALLKLGNATVGPIVEESGVARSIMHRILDRLINKGLVSYATKEKTKHYQASEPARLLDYVKERAEKLEANKKEIEAMLPQLSSLLQPTQGTEVRVYEGFNGLITVHEHSYNKLKKGEEYFYMGIAADTPSFHQAFWEKDHKRRIKAGIKCKLLFQPDYPEEQLEWRKKLWGCEVRMLSLQLKGPAWFLGYKDVIVIGMQTNTIAIEITNQAIAESFRSYFEEFWKQSKPLK
jgi:HTH-type transcriptional regulator, sugar sensing transcriptional regulator